MRFRSRERRCSSCMMDMYLIHCTHDPPRRMLLPADESVGPQRMEDAMFAVAGVSGHTGKVVAETLLAQDKAVRVIVRDAAKGEEWKKRGAEVAFADLDDPDALTKE